MTNGYAEIERKFLVTDKSITEGLTGESIAQGYLVSRRDGSVRIRLTGSQAAFLTVKGPRAGNIRREFECEVTWEVGQHLLRICEPFVVTKMRYPLLANDVLWIIDVFQDANAGLVVAEVELDNPTADIIKPPWCGREVTGEDRYYNDYLAQHPYETW